MAQLVGDDGTVFDAFTFVGGIEIDDQHDLQYVLVDNTGASTGKSITVYGELSFAENTNHLSIALAGGGIAEIQGLTGVQSLQAEKNHIAAFRADDLLIFHAETDNDIPGQDDLVTIPAKIDFVGAWDIQDGSLVFHSNIKGSPESPAVSIGFAGTLKGVTAGFVYFADKGQTQAALNITGKHVFKAENATTELAWETSIGFTGKSFLAQVDATSTTHFATGQVLAIKGDLTLQQDDGTPLKMNLSLEASYSFDANNMLVFKALITGGDQPSYDLMLQGTVSLPGSQPGVQCGIYSKPGRIRHQGGLGHHGRPEEHRQEYLPGAGYQRGRGQTAVEPELRRAAAICRRRAREGGDSRAAGAAAIAAGVAAAPPAHV